MLGADGDWGRWVRTQRGIYGSEAVGGGSIFIMRVSAQVSKARPTYKVIETGTVGLTPLNVFLPSISYPCNRKVVLLKLVTRQGSVDCHITGCVTGRLWLLDPSSAPSHGHKSPGFTSVSRGKWVPSKT